MPKALAMYLGYKIYFWIGDGDEPVHVHVSRVEQKNATKFWITSEGAELAKDTGSVDSKDMKRILAYLNTNYKNIIAEWTIHFKHAETKR